jgi:hypothetical protein
MSSTVEYLAPGPDLSTWPRQFEEAGLDYVPDPMVLRAAELFIGGRQYCRRLQLDDEKAWPVIERNIDGILAFFHVLMTRERIPMIDYEITFMGALFVSLIGDIALNVHPGYDVYQKFKDPRFRFTPTARRTISAVRSQNAKSAAEPAPTKDAIAATPFSVSPRPAPNSASPIGTTSATGSISKVSQKSPACPTSSDRALK